MFWLISNFSAANIVWWYFFSKFIDFMDSFFFVLRKKNNQLTSLHVIHHAIMPMVCWTFLKFVGGGHSTFFMFLNMGVHVVMYFYYLVSGLGPQVQKYLWWKRYITGLQYLFWNKIFVWTWYFRDAVAPVRDLLTAWMYSSVHLLHLPSPSCLLHPLPRCSLLLSLHKLLYQILHQENGFKEC